VHGIIGGARAGSFHGWLSGNGAVTMVGSVGRDTKTNGKGGATGALPKIAGRLVDAIRDGGCAEKEKT
jgi:hypothetical protein